MPPLSWDLTTLSSHILLTPDLWPGCIAYHVPHVILFFWAMREDDHDQSDVEDLQTAANTMWISFFFLHAVSCFSDLFPIIYWPPIYIFTALNASQSASHVTVGKTYSHLNKMEQFLILLITPACLVQWQVKNCNSTFQVHLIATELWSWWSLLNCQGLWMHFTYFMSASGQSN